MARSCAERAALWIAAYEPIKSESFEVRMSFVFLYHASQEALVSYQSDRKASKNQLHSDNVG
jgi:hypothetical protein